MKKNEKNNITPLEFYTKDAKKNCEKLLKFLYKNPTQQNKVIIEPDDINYDAFFGHS